MKKLFSVGVRQIGIQEVYVLAEDESEARSLVDSQSAPTIEGDDFTIVDVDAPENWEVEEVDAPDIEKLLREQE